MFNFYMSSDKRDITSSVTHFAAALLALVGCVKLAIYAFHAGGLKEFASVLVFGVSMILLYSASAVYHWIDDAKARAKAIMRQVDHIAIFFLIAGTYTPICVLTLGHPIGTWMLAAVWGIAVFGLFMKIFWMNAPHPISCGLYLAMGWVCICAIKPLAANLHPWGIFWLAAGGLIYTAGGLIYGFEKPDIKLKWFGSHELFHLFVIGGSVCHYVTVYFFVA